jgi:hypothetical protein
MTFDMPKAVFCGLALIAAAIFFGPGSVPATASDGLQKIAICSPTSGYCMGVGPHKSAHISICDTHNADCARINGGFLQTY